MSEIYDEAPSVDDIFKVIMIDRKRKVKMHIQLQDKHGDEVPIRETVEKLTEWVLDKVKDDEPNTCQQQIVPLMGQAVASGLIKLLGPSIGTVMMSQEETRYSLVHMMTMSFYLLKWLQKKEIHIHTYEEPVTQDDLDKYDRVSRASDLTVQMASMGGDPKKVIELLLEQGKLKTSDLKEMGLGSETKQEGTEGVN